MMCGCVPLTGSLVEPLWFKEEDRVGVSYGGQEKTLGLAGSSRNHHLSYQETDVYLHYYPIVGYRKWGTSVH